MAKTSLVKCYNCKKYIDKNKDHFVDIATYNVPKLRRGEDHNFFHFECFVFYMNKKVEEKARNIVGDMQSKALSNCLAWKIDYDLKQLEREEEHLRNCAEEGGRLHFL